MPIYPPSFTEDGVYSASQDRYFIKSMGLQPGVVNSSDLTVQEGAGLQVEVNEGLSIIEQTEPVGGYYNVPITGGRSIPYNNVVVSSVNPQIAQIILRVYDNPELKVSGSSFARFEWLNGTPTASATEAKMKEGKFEGVAPLPRSSLRLARVLVPKNATKSEEYYIEDARTFANELLESRLPSKRAFVNIGNTYSPLVERTVGTEYEPSATRSASVMLKLTVIHGKSHPIYVGGVEISEVQAEGTEGFGIFPIYFKCPAGKKWKVGGEAATLKSSYLIE